MQQNMKTALPISMASLRILWMVAGCNTSETFGEGAASPSPSPSPNEQVQAPPDVTIKSAEESPPGAYEVAHAEAAKSQNNSNVQCCICPNGSMSNGCTSTEVPLAMSPQPMIVENLIQ